MMHLTFAIFGHLHRNQCSLLRISQQISLQFTLLPSLLSSSDQTWAGKSPASRGWRDLVWPPARRGAPPPLSTSCSATPPSPALPPTSAPCGPADAPDRGVNNWSNASWSKCPTLIHFFEALLLDEQNGDHLHYLCNQERIKSFVKCYLLLKPAAAFQFLACQRSPLPPACWCCAEKGPPSKVNN